MIRSLALILILGGTALAGRVDAPTRSLSPAEWQDLAPGVETAHVQAERYCLAGGNRVLLVRVDPARCRIAPFHESEYTGPPATLAAWAERLEASVVVNAGLYDPQRRHLGLLRRDGADLGGLPHRTWKGYLLLDPAPADSADTTRLAVAALLDGGEAEPLVPRYRSVVQSMMLFDPSRQVRVRASDKLARRVLLGQDREGRLVLAVTEGLYRLADCAALLTESTLELESALVLDGGSEAQVSLRANGRVEHFPNDMVTEPTPPAVLAVWPGPRSP